MNDWIVPDWPALKNVKALFTTRNGGVSGDRDNTYATLNLGGHVNDSLLDVQNNRAILSKYLPATPKWLEQVHGTTLLCMDNETTSLQGDAALSRTRGIVCAVMVADCLPVFLCDRAGTTVAVVHAGWRGLAAGIIEKTVAEMGDDQTEIIAWLGPAIGLIVLKSVGKCVRCLSIKTANPVLHLFRNAARIAINGWQISFSWHGCGCLMLV